MTLLNTIEKFANNIVRFIGINDDDTPCSVSKQNSNNHILSLPDGKPIDECSISDKARNKIQTELTIKQSQNKIIEKCQKAGIKASNILNQLLEYRCMTKEAYDKLNNDEKLILWQGFAQVVESAVQIKGKYGSSPSADVNTIISQMLNVYQEDQSHGNIIKAQEVLDLAGDINAEIKDKNIENKSKNELFDIFGKIYKSVSKKFESFEQEKLKGLAGQEREHAKQIADRTKDKAEKMRLLQLNMTQDSKTAYFGLMSTSSNQLAWGTQALLDSRISDKERMNVADNIMTFENQADIIEQHCARGDAPLKEIVRDMTGAAVSEMSECGVQAFSCSYGASRSSGKHKIFEEKGYYTQMAGGIGAGTILNKNMSNSAKCKFLKDFLDNEEKFNDVEEVKSAVKESINHYVSEYSKTHSANETANLRTKLQKTLSAISDIFVLGASDSVIPKHKKIKNIKTHIKNTAKKIYVKPEEKEEENNKISKYKTQKSNTTTSPLAKIKKDNIDFAENKKRKTTPSNLTIDGNTVKLPNVKCDDISILIRKGLPIDFVAKECDGKEFAKFCISDNNGTSYLNQINDIIINTKPKELAMWKKNIAGYNYIVDTLPIDKAEEYIQLTTMGISVKELAQNRIEKRKIDKDKYGQKENAAS